MDIDLTKENLGGLASFEPNIHLVSLTEIKHFEDKNHNSKILWIFEGYNGKGAMAKAAFTQTYSGKGPDQLRHGFITAAHILLAVEGVWDEGSDAYKQAVMKLQSGISSVKTGDWKMLAAVYKTFKQEAPGNVDAELLLKITQFYVDSRTKLEVMVGIDQMNRPFAAPKGTNILSFNPDIDVKRPQVGGGSSTPASTPHRPPTAPPSAHPAGVPGGAMPMNMPAPPSMPTPQPAALPAREQGGSSTAETEVGASEATQDDLPF